MRFWGVCLTLLFIQTASLLLPNNDLKIIISAERLTESRITVSLQLKSSTEKKIIEIKQ